MITLYDMNTGRIIESGKYETARKDEIQGEWERQTQAQLQIVTLTPQDRKVPAMPPELIDAELDGFLQQMR